MLPATASVAETGQAANDRFIDLKIVAAFGFSAKKRDHHAPLRAVRGGSMGIKRCDDKVGDFMWYSLFDELIAVLFQQRPVIADNGLTWCGKTQHPRRFATQVEANIDRMQYHSKMGAGLSQQRQGELLCLFFKIRIPAAHGLCFCLLRMPSG